MQGRFLQSFEPGSLLRALARTLISSRANVFSVAPLAQAERTLALDLLRHELRAPVAGILGLCELLQKSDLSCEQFQLANAVEASGQQLLRLISRFGAGIDAAGAGTNRAREPGKKQALNGPVFMEQIIRAHWPDAQRKGIGLFLLYDHRLPACWHADIGCLRQLLDNLLSNAIKFTRHGYVLVEVRQEQLDSCGRVDVELMVSDTGIGIAHCDRARIYAIGEQGSGDVADLSSGSGLGLYVCKHMVSLLGGSITHESPGDARTSFRVQLPGLAVRGAREFERLQAGLLKGINCLLAVRPPLAAVLEQLLLRMGAPARAGSTPRAMGIPAGVDAVIVDSSLLTGREHQVAGRSNQSRIVLLSRRYMPDTLDIKARQEFDVIELPQPVLRSNLEPHLLRLALQKKLHAQASGDA